MATTGLDWQESHLGRYPEIRVAKDNRNRLWLCFPDKCDDANVYSYVDEARESRGVQFQYGDESQENFANTVLDDYRHVLEMYFRRLQQDESQTKNINPDLKERVESFRRLKPQQLVVTGNGAQVLALFQLESDIA